ncbi:non-heme ferritin [Marinobacterium arenosum]|uniref:non-heme ferritin n=1 Tax=Marinobacterium arenosum TaxID=2862496 RepID=UPI001C94360A|nr:non-heme ferritin [Marinobacterium arenosum]MBY4676295.1 non-heme ferritin [Marinobacterium arenosum]
MLTQAMVDKLNEQINLEFYSSNLYLQMSAWAEYKGFEGCAEFLKQHADEEMQHMKRLFTYVNETGAIARIGSIEAPPEEFTSIKDLFEKVYEHESLVTRSINELAHTAFSNQDYSTFNFLQWYVAEQHEEEKLFKGILDKIEIIGEDGKGLFFIDKEIGKLVGQESGSIMDAPAEV